MAAKGGMSYAWIKASIAAQKVYMYAVYYINVPLLQSDAHIV
jgi:hypothetical protein